MTRVTSSLMHVLACSTLLSAARVHAQQVVVVDETYTATAQNTNDSHYPVTPEANTPANWTTPVDYAKGSAYVLLDILEKPSAAKTLYNICFENSANYACMPYAPTYTATGRDDFHADFSTFYQYADMDWTKGVSKVSLILKDENQVKKQGDAMFYPTKVHVVITLVAQGATYVPPAGGAAGGGAGAAAGGGGRAGSAGAGSGGRRGSAGAGGMGGHAGVASGAGASSAGTSAAGAAGASGAGAASGAGGVGASGKGAASDAGVGPTGQAGVSAAVGGSAGAASAGRAGSSVSSYLKDSSGCSTQRSNAGAAWWQLLVSFALLRRVSKRRAERRRGTAPSTRA